MEPRKIKDKELTQISPSTLRDDKNATRDRPGKSQHGTGALLFTRIGKDKEKNAKKQQRRWVNSIRGSGMPGRFLSAH